MIDIRFPYFHLSDGLVSYIIRILPEGHAGHVYFGQALGDLDLPALEYLCSRQAKSAGTVKTHKGSPFSLADQMLEYPVYGTSGFQTPALDVRRDGAILYMDLAYQEHRIHRGKHKMMPGPQSRPDPQAQTLELILADRVHDIEVRLFYTLYPGSGTIVRSARVTNCGKDACMLEQAASGVLNLKDGQWDWTTLCGSWARERQLETRRLGPGAAVCESLYGSSSHQYNPFCALTAVDGRAYGCNLIYSSNFQAKADVNEFGMVRLVEGIHPHTFSWRLDSGQSFQTPEMLLLYAPDGLDGLSRRSSRFLRDHLINPRFAYSHRPVCLNSWEAVYFSLDESRLLELARRAAAAGIECFVVDDGWFGRRDADNNSLGDWVEDRRKFPRGIGHLAQEVRNLGMQFGLWFEPEMISEDSDLCRQHPEWVLRPDKGRVSYGRSQLVLDFTRPEVVEEIFRMMKDVIEATGLTYIKWDMNRDITEAWSPWLHQTGHVQGEVFHRYIQGVYALYEKLTAAFPDVLIEACAGGGGRFDAGILYYSPQIWVSDNTDGYDRLKIQYATSMAYPLSSLSNHVSEVPNHQTGRRIPLAFRKNTALFGIFGYELDLLKEDCPGPEQIREQIREYLRMEPAVLHGDFYHLVSPFDSNEPAQALAWKDEVFAGLFQIQSDLKGTILPSLPLPFLKDGCWSTGSVLLPAAVLREFGLRKPLKNNGANQAQARWMADYQSALVRLERKAGSASE